MKFSTSSVHRYKVSISDIIDEPFLKRKFADFISKTFKINKSRHVAALDNSTSDT